MLQIFVAFFVENLNWTLLLFFFFVVVHKCIKSCVAKVPIWVYQSFRSLQELQIMSKNTVFNLIFVLVETQDVPDTIKH